MANKCLHCRMGVHARVHVHFWQVDHACTGVYIKQVLCASAYTFAYTLATGCAYALMYVQFVHSALGNEGVGVEVVYEGACCLAWVVIFDRRRDWGVVCVFSIFNAGGSVCGCMCVYMHTHTHCTDGVLACEPRGLYETPGGPEKSRWTKSRHICIRICVQSTHAYAYARRRDEILD